MKKDLKLEKPNSPDSKKVKQTNGKEESEDVEMTDVSNGDDAEPAKDADLLTLEGR